MKRTIWSIALLMISIGAMAQKPLIGISTGYSASDNTASVRFTYVDAVVNAGGIPVLIPLAKDSLAAAEVMNKVDALILSGGEDVHPFFYEDEALGLTLESMLLMTNDDDYRHGNGSLINDMLKGTDYYHSYVPFKLEERGSVKIGFRIELPKKGGQMPFIDYFHLFYYGKNEISTGIAEATTSNEVKAPAGIYDLKGQLVRANNDVKGLAKGLYKKKKKKVVIK